MSKSILTRDELAKKIADLCDGVTYEDKIEGGKKAINLVLAWRMAHEPRMSEDRQCNWIRRYSRSGFIWCMSRLGHDGDHQHDPLCEADAKIAGPWEVNANDGIYPVLIR